MEKDYIESKSEDISVYVIYVDETYAYVDKEKNIKIKEKDLTDAFADGLLIDIDGKKYVPFGIKRFQPSGVIPYKEISYMVDNVLKTARSTNISDDPAYAVKSVNGKVGDVVLDKIDIGIDEYVKSVSDDTEEHKLKFTLSDGSELIVNYMGGEPMGEFLKKVIIDSGNNQCVFYDQDGTEVLRLANITNVSTLAKQEDLESLENDVSDIQTDVSDIQTDVSDIRTDLANNYYSKSDFTEKTFKYTDEDGTVTNYKMPVLEV